MYCHICLFSLKDLVQTRQHRHVRVKCTVQCTAQLAETQFAQILQLRDMLMSPRGWGQ